MKRLSAILTIAALVLLLHVAHISVCYSADNAADPNIEALSENCSDIIASTTVLPQVVAPAADSSNALIIRIPLPEKKVIITGIIILICLVLAVIYIRRHYKARNTAARESKQTHVLMAQDDAATDVRQDIAASAPTEVTYRTVLQTEMSDSTPCAVTDEQQIEIASNVADRSQGMSATDITGSANTSNSEHLNGGGSSNVDMITEPKAAENAHLSEATDWASEDFGPQSETARPNIGVAASADTEEAQDKPAQGVGVPVSASDQDLIQRLEEFVSAQMHNVDLSVDDIAGAMCMSRSTLFRRVKQIYGINPNEYLRQRRLSYAADLLQQNKYTISDICLLVGFNSPSYFSRNNTTSCPRITVRVSDNSEPIPIRSGGEAVTARIVREEALKGIDKPAESN